MTRKSVKKRAPARKAGTEIAPLDVMPALTKNQAKCLEFIFNFYRAHKHFPTHREINAAMGSTATTAAMYIDPLVEKGYLTRAPERGRNIRLTVDGLERLKLMGVRV
jgi:DNA-binding MarR family transcriptional regulator